eukprot:6145332-Amphidinium_carterae.1
MTHPCAHGMSAYVTHQMSIVSIVLRTLWLKVTTLECASSPLDCDRKCRVSMACMSGKRKTQNSETCTEPLGLAHTPHRGRYVTRRTMYLFDKNTGALHSITSMDMWTKLGRVPPSYMENPTDSRHGYYNFHTEVQYTIKDFINLYVYNYPEDYNQNSIQFTGQDYYFVVVHTTDKLLEGMTSDLKIDRKRLQLVFTQRRG